MDKQNGDAPGADEESNVIVSLPGEPLEFFLLGGRPALIYEENGERKAAYYEPPDHFHPIDPWYLDWGDLAGVGDAQPISQFSFGVRLQIAWAMYQEQQKAVAEKGTETQNEDASDPTG